jgi:FAD:protein FMN transferase
MSRPKFAILIGLVLVLALIVVARSRNPLQVPQVGQTMGEAATGFTTFTTPVMGTEIQAILPEGPGAAAAAESVFAVFHEVDARMSEWKPTSPLSEVNAAAGERAVAVPKDLRDLLHRSLEIGRMTDGAFDVTWAALWGLWDFKSPDHQVPDSAEVARRAALVDYRKLVIDDAAGTVELPVTGMKVGLGGIAKGYALDRAVEKLHALGIPNFMLLGGGQVYVSGTKDGRPWRIGIRDPRGAPDDFFATLEGTNVSTSTSGDYESYFIANGVRYHHILDPRTGWPARGLRSVTTISADATLADALSTSIMVMGKERGLAMLDSIPGVDAVLVDDEGKVAVTPGLEGRLSILRPPR